jgi:hypothetical protein
MAKHQYTILSMMKDEGHSLVEWVAYHKHIGFDNICVYTNDCSDGTDEMLILLQELGLVQHFENNVPEGKKPQPNALSLAAENSEILDSDWVLTMDADEFVSIKCGDGMIDTLIGQLPPETDAMAITWRFFGSSEVTDWNCGLVTETYTRGAPDRFRKGWGVKSMFKPRQHVKFGIHRPTNKQGKIEQLGDDADILQHWVNGSGIPMPDSFKQKGWRSTGRTLAYDMVEMNHYAVKSYEAYLLRRIRGNVNNKADKYNAGYFAIFDRNEEEHLNVQRHSAALHAKIDDILSDPKMRDLQDKALNFHAARVEKLRSLGEYDPWLVELQKASSVDINRLDEVLFTQHLPKIWQEKIKEMQASGVPDDVIAKMVARSVGIKAENEDNADDVLDPARPTQRGDNRSDAVVEKGNKVPELDAKVNPEASARKYKTTILSMMKDEGHSVLEWVAYHKMIGFENICVYTNNCNDGTDKMLMRLQEMGLVQHFRNDVPEGKRPQMNALSLAERNPEVMSTEWLLVMDADEFLTVKTGDGNIDDLLDAMDEDAQAMAITWRFFGSSGITDWRPGLVAESYTQAATDGFRKGWGVKTMFKPYADIKLGIHRPSIRKLNHRPERAKVLLDQLWLNGSGAPLPEEFSLSGWRSTRPTIGYELAEMNHYAVKSYEAYLLRRVRGNVNNKEDKYNAAYFAYFDRNESEPGAIKRHVPALKAKVEALLEDPELRKLQDEALAYHESRVQMLRDSGEYDHWLSELKEASTIDVENLKDSVIFTQHLPKYAQDDVARMKLAGVLHDDIRDFIDSLRTASKGSSRSALIAHAKGEDPSDTPTQEDHDTRTSREDATMAADLLIEKVSKKTQTTPLKQGSQVMIKAQTNGRKVLVSTMKNEGLYLLEWLAYHKSIGIDDFCIFSNDCTDGTNLMLNRLDQMGVIKHFDNPLGPRMDPQRAAYSRANKMNWVKNAEWVLIVDADEFLNIHVGDRSIDALIEACGAPDAISINWRLMGSQGQSKMSTDLVSERFTRGSSFDDPENGLVWGFKTLFRPAQFSFFGVHRPKFDKEVEVVDGMVTWTNAAGQPMGDKYLHKGWRGNEENVTNKFAQVNHYAIKSREDFLLKRLRGTANSKNKDRIDMEYWDKYDINTIEDTTIPTTGIRAQMDEWLEDGDLAALSRACADCSQRVLDYQLTVAEFRTFIDTGHFAKMKEAT